MLGDICDICSAPAMSCGCHHKKDCDTPPEPCVPCDTGECPESYDMACVFWMGDPIPNTPIMKGMRMTEVVTYLLSRINALS